MMSKTENELKLSKPKSCILEISKLGYNCLNCGYKKIETRNPIELALISSKMFAENFAKNEEPYFLYLYACAILHNLSFEEKNLLDDIKKFELNKYDIIKTGDEEDDSKYWIFNKEVTKEEWDNRFKIKEQTE